MIFTILLPPVMYFVHVFFIVFCHYITTCFWCDLKCSMFSQSALSKSCLSPFFFDKATLFRKLYLFWWYSGVKYLKRNLSIFLCSFTETAVTTLMLSTMFILSSISISLKFWSVKNSSLHENPGLEVLNTITILGEISNKNWQNENRW